jgi:hypothetical protein
MTSACSQCFECAARPWRLWRPVRVVVVIAVAMLWFGLGSGLGSQMGQAKSKTAASVAEAWGLLGVWSIDCAKPADGDNNRFSYRAGADGGIEHDREIGGNDQGLRILSAKIGASGEIELLIDLPAFGQKRIFALQKGSDGRIRAISNYNVATKDYSVRAGTFVGSGKPTPWQTKCGNAPVS